ncbi:hypothetical protein HPG69_010620 [Diceros bicornis minor]|uniref:Uncharacterized protein n=1 Tax=Diceros bicornis minor TaxID=77932 RepID=A0A7J7FGT6_DICBM|nr:hypothetical protein HPG69_010620 [Diceros bicornis minor]
MTGQLPAATRREGNGELNLLHDSQVPGPLLEPLQSLFKVMDTAVLEDTRDSISFIPLDKLLHKTGTMATSSLKLMSIELYNKDGKESSPTKYVHFRVCGASSLFGRILTLLSDENKRAPSPFLNTSRPSAQNEEAAIQLPVNPALVLKVEEIGEWVSERARWTSRGAKSFHFTLYRPTVDGKLRVFKTS